MKEEGAAAIAKAITGLSAGPGTRKKYTGEFGRYHAFCVEQSLNFAAMKNENVLAYIDARCAQVGNSVSAGQWRSQLWMHAEVVHGCRAYGPADEPFWRRAYKGLATKYGCDSVTPPALTRAKMLRVYEALEPDIKRDPYEYNDWLHLLASYHFLWRPNEHTGAGGRHCVAGNIRVKKTPKGNRAIVYTFKRGTTKGERLRGVVGPSRKALRSATLADSGREATLTREMPGSPLCLIAALAPMWQLRSLGEHPERLLFPSTRGDRFHVTPMTAKEWNQRMKAMMNKAGVTGYTARAARSGRRADLGAEGVIEETKDAVGRWRRRRGTGSSAGRQYDRLSIPMADQLPDK